MSFGPSSHFVKPLALSCDIIHRSKCVKYLDVHLASGPKLGLMLTQ